MKPTKNDDVMRQTGRFWRVRAADPLDRQAPDVRGVSVLDGSGSHHGTGHVRKISLFFFSLCEPVTNAFFFFALPGSHHLVHAHVKKNGRVFFCEALKCGFSVSPEVIIAHFT